MSRHKMETGNILVFDNIYLVKQVWNRTGPVAHPLRQALLYLFLEGSIYEEEK